jgi:type II secretory pathway pseudopilin PulG
MVSDMTPDDRCGPRPARSRRRRSGERGVLLVALLVGITVMLILLTASAQSWTAIMKREREEELIFRGNQYIHAIKAYHKERGQFPTELKALFEAGPRGGRYIRTLYADPFSEDGEWNLIYLGPDGKTPFNPNAPNPGPGIPGLPGANAVQGVPGLARSDPRLSDRLRDQPSGRNTQGGSSLRDRKRKKSGFASGNLTSPIVGVVSRGIDQGFREYMGMQYYDEWEFHVFLLEMDPQGRSGGRIPGMNINPQGLRGVGHGAQPIVPGQGPNQRPGTGFVTDPNVGGNRPRGPGRSDGGN